MTHPWGGQVTELAAILVPLVVFLNALTALNIAIFIAPSAKGR